MNITEVRIKLMDEGDDRLQAFCSITFNDSFVVRDLKIIDGSSGPFVAMPSRKLTAHCPYCRGKNHLRASYCNQCGKRLPQGFGTKDQEGRVKLYADIAHPINSECRELIQRRVIEAFEAELALSKQPGYVSSYEDYPDFDEDDSPAPASPIDPPRPTRRVEAGSEPLPPRKSTRPRRDTAPPPADEFGKGVF